MSFDEVLDQIRALLQQRGRVTYGALKRRFTLDDEYLEDIKGELIRAEGVAADEAGDVLVWTGGTTVVSSQFLVVSPQLLTPNTQSPAERRQLTVMFCDLVGSTALSTQLDPEDLRDVVRQYQQTCAEVIERYDGYIAQYLGDGILVYFGYPTAHEDDARRAVYAGLEIIAALQSRARQQAVNTPLPHGRGSDELQVRIGIHTGVVVVGQMGGGGRHEQLALGETPNIAARLEGLAEPNTVVISAATARLVQHTFQLENLGKHDLKGIAEPMVLSRVLGPQEEQSDEDETTSARALFLVGRDEEVGLLHRRWEQSKEGMGQVVLLSGEAGIGKSSLVETSRNAVKHARAASITFRCSPYHQHSALYPIIAHLQRLLRWQPEESPAAKLDKLEQLVQASRLPVAEAVPLFAALLSLPVPAAQYPPLNLSPQQQRQHTHDLLVALLVEEAARQPVQVTWEDVHWADPSTLEVLGLVIEQAPTVRMLNLLTYRPEFHPPWPLRSHITPLTLNRLERLQVEALVTHLAGGKVLPAEVMQHVVSKTDGVPLFVEELTKTVLESNVLRQVNGHYELLGPLSTLAIPSTLQDSLMARLDRHPVSKEVAQLGAVLGREFAYATLKALTLLDDATLQERLAQLVEAELLYQRGRPPRAHYVFKHALIQDAAYASLLKSSRQHYHQQIAHLFEHQFPDLVETQPELVAHHYTEAGLIEQALPYWQQAGRRAAQRSANVEAVSHLRRGLALVETLPETLERSQHELAIQATLGPVLIQTQGWAAPETGAAYLRATALCQQLGETAQHFPVLYGVWAFQVVRPDYQTARKLGEQLLHLAEREQDSALLVEAHFTLGLTLFHLGEVAAGRRHCEQSVAHYDAQQHRALAIAYGHDPAMSALIYEACALWLLGYPEQALRQNQASVTLAHGLAHPFSLAYALCLATVAHQYRREWAQTQEQAEAAIALATEQGFPHWIAQSTIYRGRAVVEHGRAADGIAQMRWGIAAMRDIGSEGFQSFFLGLLAEAYLHDGQVEEGLATVAEALACVDRTAERFHEAELWRIKGELLLAQAGRVETPR
ncbi:MAG: AAA family ATPase [Deltaproteobacteria bacterium]|nr:AAA family ATPase [Deltaproteobacteria bacterium]